MVSNHYAPDLATEIAVSERRDIPISVRWRSITYRWWLPIAMLVVGDQLRQMWGGVVAPFVGFSLAVLAATWLSTWFYPAWAQRWGDRVISLAVLVPVVAGTVQAVAAPDVTAFALLQTLAFWAPLVGVYWAMCYYDRPSRAAALAVGLYGCLVLADQLALQQAGRSLLGGSLLAFGFQGLAVLGIIGIFAITHRHVSELIVQRDLARGDAAHDPLTGLYNRRHFTHELERAVAHARRHQRPLSLVMLDLDHFKRFNDRHGHGFGDLVLKHAAAAVSERARTCDVVCRWGGEEFAIILADTALDQAVGVAESMRMTLAADALPGGEHATASFGVAEFDGEETPTRIFERADCAVQLAKLAGRNQTKYCRARMAPPFDEAGHDPRCCEPHRASRFPRCAASRPEPALPQPA